MRTKLLLATALSAIALVSSATAANLVVNGDFEAGYTGFGSDYAIHVPTVNQAEYSITTSPSLVHPQFASFGDHTTGLGNMMVVNGAPSTTARVWYENGIGVSQNTTYFFSTWIRSAINTSPAQLNFSINMNGIGMTFTAGTVASGWQQFYTTWNSGSASAANIALVNQNTAFSGNDFALDDIVLDTIQPGGTSVVPEPATWAMMIMGFGAAGAALRRRARAYVRIA